MTDLLEKAMTVARRLPPSVQDDIARMMLAFADEAESIVQLSPKEDASFAESLAQAERRHFATDEEVRAVWSRHGL